MNKGNYLFLGIAAGYVAIAIIQWCAPGLLPISLYISVAWVSLTITILELVKTIFQYMQAIHARQIKITQGELYLCDKHIRVMGRFDTLKAEVEQHTDFRTAISEKAKKLGENKSIQKLGKMIDVISVAQIVTACVMVAVTSLKRIPNDLANNKLVGILSLLAFAFLMLTYFVKGSIEPLLKESELTIRNADMLENYYLDMLDKVAPKSNQDDGEEQTV